MGQSAGVGVGHHIRDDDEGAGRQGVADRAGVGHADGRIGGHNPQGLEPTVAGGPEQIHGLQSGGGRQGRGAPEPPDAIPMVLGEIHMGGQGGGQPPDLAPAHGVRLSGNGEGRRAGLSDPTGRQMKIDDGVGLVGALGRLVHALTEQGDGAGMTGRQIEEGVEDDRIETAGRRGGARVRVLRNPLPKAFRGEDMGRDIGLIDLPSRTKRRQKTVEKSDVCSGAKGQMQIRHLSGLGAARIDDDKLDAAPRPGRLDPLPDHGMAPGGVGADQHDQIGRLQILVTGRHDVLAEGPQMGRHRAGHAKS